MKIIFMGSPAFAVPSLEALLQAGHQIPLVVCQPDKPAGRGLKVQACPIATFANSKRLTLFQPISLKDAPLDLPDLIVVVAYGKILPKNILEIPPRGCINVHASLLPKYRGAAPINWAIVKGEDVTGVTTMLLNERLDAGDILLQEETKIGAGETALHLHDRLAKIGAALLLKTIEQLDTIKPRPQDETKATYAPILKKEDGRIDWRCPAKEIYNLIRGMQPWPVAHTYIEGKTLRIFETRAEAGGSKTPGTVVKADYELAVATGDGTLYLLEVQLEGKKRMNIGEFLRGNKIKEGSTFEQ